MTTALIADRRGSVLVEFALVALVTTLLFAATTDLGRLVFTAQVVQDAARAGARELAVTPLPAGMTFDEALLDPNIRTRVFDPDQLAIDITGPMTDHTFNLNDTCASLPVINRVLCPLMVVEYVKDTATWLLRYPGALVPSDTSEDHLTVRIPHVLSASEDGTQQIEWVRVVEEIRSDPCGAGSFSLAAGGLVALRINYPFQAAAMSGFRPSDDPDTPNIGHPILADDSAVIVSPASPPCNDAEPVAHDTPDDGGPYAGLYGLGRQFAFAGKTVRPFRRLISAQAVFRREVFQEQQQQGATP